MKAKKVSLGKTTRPSLAGVLPRSRLFALLDRPHGAGDLGHGPARLRQDHACRELARPRRRCARVWYQLDEGDADVATFFYYLSLAAASLDGERERLPLLTPEYQPGLGVFTRRYFERLYAQLKAPFALVFDGYQEVPASSQLHEVMRVALETLPPRRARAHHQPRRPARDADAAAREPGALRDRLGRAAPDARGGRLDRRQAPPRVQRRGGRRALRAHPGLGGGAGADARAGEGLRRDRRAAGPGEPAARVRLPRGRDLPEIRRAHAAVPAAHGLPARDDHRHGARAQRRRGNRASCSPGSTATTIS